MALININIKVEELRWPLYKERGKESDQRYNYIYIILSESDNDSTLYENTSTLSC